MERRLDYVTDMPQSVCSAIKWVGHWELKGYHDFVKSTRQVHYRSAVSRAHLTGNSVRGLETCRAPRRTAGGYTARLSSYDLLASLPPFQCVGRAGSVRDLLITLQLGGLSAFS